MTPHAWRRVNRVQLGELIGVHPDTITDYARSGMPVLARGGAGREGAYDAVECLVWWRVQQGGNAKEVAQTRAYQAQAKLNELKLQVQRATLVPAEDVILAGQHYTRAWTAKVRALPRQLMQAGLLAREQETAAAAFIRHLLEDIAGWKILAEVKRAAHGPAEETKPHESAG